MVEGSIRSFARLGVQGWRQFSSVDIDLSRQVTVLTGENGTGKTSLLTLLSRHFGWNLSFVSTPYIGRRTAQRIWSDVYTPLFGDADELSADAVTIGQVEYDTGERCELIVNRVSGGAQYQPEYRRMMETVGLHIPSHRQVTTYNQVQNIPAEPLSAVQQYQQYQQLLTQAYGGGRAENPGKIQKQSLISLAMFGEGNSSVTPNHEMARVFLEFQQVLRKLLPKSLGFDRLEVRMPEVVLVTQSGTFAVDAMSGGIAALFSIAWQVHMFGYDKVRFTVTIDEPENHLHPSMQRTFLRNLAGAFPNCKLVVASHSPFIVSSFPEATVVALTYDNDRKVRSLELDVSDLSGTPNEVLREILFVDSNLPVWVESQIDQAVQESSEKPPDQRAAFIMAALERLGIADSIVEYRRKNADENK
jgi:hypothetical protein